MKRGFWIKCNKCARHIRIISDLYLDRVSLEHPLLKTQTASNPNGQGEKKPARDKTAINMNLESNSAKDSSGMKGRHLKAGRNPINECIKLI